MKTEKSKTGQKDRIDALVDNLDKYYFRIGSARNELGGSTYTHMEEDSLHCVSEQFETPGAKKAKELFYENLKEVKDKELRDCLENAVYCWQAEQDTFPMLLGYILGLRIAGIDSERTKQMARTWRLGYPQDDEKEAGSDALG